MLDTEGAGDAQKPKIDFFSFRFKTHMCVGERRKETNAQYERNRKKISVLVILFFTFCDDHMILLSVRRNFD